MDLNELLVNPAIQAGVAPFLVALIVAGPLRRSRMLGLAIGAGFLVVVVLTMGLSFESLTSTRKLVLVGLAATLLVMPFEAVPPGRLPAARAIMLLAAGVAAVWVLMRVLAQQSFGPAAGAGLAAAVFLMLLLESSHRACQGDPVGSAALALMLGLGTGVLALIGASAQLAQLCIAIGAAGGAVLLVQMLAGRPAERGWTLLLPAVVVIGLAGLLAVFTGTLPWFCLLPILAIPWALRLVPKRARPTWLTAFLAALAVFVPMILAVTFAWFVDRSFT